MRGSYELTGHLIALGHRRISFLSGLPDMSVTTDRLRGYKTALRDAGIAVEPRLIRPAAFREGVAETVARELLKGRGRPTAIVAANDLMALGVMQTAEEMGLRVPQDLALVGFQTPGGGCVLGVESRFRASGSRLSHRRVSRTNRQPSSWTSNPLESGYESAKEALDELARRVWHV